MQRGRPVEGVRLVHAGNEERAVALGELAEYGGDVVRAADEHIQRRFRAAKSYIGAARKDSRHDRVRAAAVGEFDLDALFFEITERVGNVHRGIENGVRDFVDANLFQPALIRFTGGKRQDKEQRA